MYVNDECPLNEGGSIDQVIVMPGSTLRLLVLRKFISDKRGGACIKNKDLAISQDMIHIDDNSRFEGCP